MATTDKTFSSGKTGITDRIKEDGRQKLESTKRSAADQIDQVAQALSRAGQELNQSQPTLANYATQFSSTVSTLAARLRDGNLDELIDETRALARRNPGLFLAGGVALGFALSRFLKASGDEMQRSGYAGLESSDYGTEDYARASSYAGTGDSSSYGATQRGADTTFDLESSHTSGSRTRDDFSSPRSNGG
jgi:hypothetical protein